jgi:hypothetical protein
MHVYQLGKPYHPDRKVWPECAQFNFRGGELELVLFFDGPSAGEIEAVRTGRSEFALYDGDNLVVLCYRFEGKRAQVPWSDAPYQWHLLPESMRFPVPDPARLGPGARVILHVILVNATGGIIQALRQVTLSPEFSRRLYRAITHQAAAPWDRAAYDRQLESLYAGYPSTADLVKACRWTTEGGA